MCCVVAVVDETLGGAKTERTEKSVHSLLQCCWEEPRIEMYQNICKFRWAKCAEASRMWPRHTLLHVAQINSNTSSLALPIATTSKAECICPSVVCVEIVWQFSKVAAMKTRRMGVAAVPTKTPRYEPIRPLPSPSLWCLSFVDLVDRL